MKKNDLTKPLAAAVKNVLEAAAPRLPYNAPRLIPAAAFGSINDANGASGIVIRRLLQTGAA